MAKQKHNTYYNENTPDSGIYYYNENGEAKKVDVGSTYSAGEGIKIEEKIISVSADYAYNSAVSSLHNTTLTSTDDSVEISSTTAADGTVNYDLKVEVHSDTEIVGENGISAEKVQNTSTWKVGVSADYALKSDIPEITSYSAGNGIDSELIANHIVAVSENYATEEYVDDEIAKLGKPLTYSGSKTVEQINALTDVKVGTVYTIAGESGTIVSGNVECKPGDEVAWASTDEWFLIGNTIPEIQNSWKQWSEDNGSTSDSNTNVYVGNSNNINDSVYTFEIGSQNTANSCTGTFNIGKYNSANKSQDSVNIGESNETYSGFVVTNIGMSNIKTSSIDCSSYSASAPANTFASDKSFMSSISSLTIKDETYYPGGVNLGYRNKMISPAINIGKDNISITSYDVGDNISIGKSNINYYGVAIGQGNFTSGYSWILGQFSIADAGSLAVGKSCSAAGGSFVFGESSKSQRGSYAIGYRTFTDGHSLAFGQDGVYANSEGLALGSRGITADGGVVIGKRGVWADLNNAGTNGNISVAIGCDGVWAYNGATAIGSNGVTAKNRHALAIGSECVYAENGDSIAIGARGNTAMNNSIHIGVKGKADNRSIIFNTSDNMNSHPGYFYANNYSLINYADECSTQATATIGSVVLGAGRNSLLSADKGSIIFDALSYDCNNVTGQRFINYAIQNSISLVTPSNNVDYDVIHNNNSDYRDTSYFTVKNNSLLLGAGTNGYLVVENDSYLIGGNTSGNMNGYVKNGSWVLGYNNMANGGNFILGHKNDAGGTSADIGTSAEVRPYNQSIILGNNNFVRNYKPYIYAPKSVFSGHKLFSAYISTASYKDSRGAGTYLGSSEATVRNLVVGDYNRVTGYNAFVFGIGNYAGVESYDYNTRTSSISGDSDDDGFTFTFGMHSHAVRNYDIAIGLGTTASGGENIAIGTMSNGNHNPPLFTVAKGYKNISYHSHIEGILNVGFASDVPLTFDKNNDSVYTNNIFNTVKNNVWNYSTLNFHDNRLDCVTGSTLGVQYNFNRNKLTYITNSTIGVSGSYGHFAYNDLFMCDYGTTISAQYASKNTIRCISGAKFYGTNLHDNIFYNLGYQTYISSFDINQNIIFDVGVNSGSNTTIQINLSATHFNKNYIFNSELLGSAMGAGFNHNLIMYSKISANNNALPYGVSYGNDTIGHSVLVGTNVNGQVTETFSFAASDTRSTEASAVNNAVLARVYKITNFGDNNIQNSYETQVFGEDNIVSSVGNSFVVGRKNLVQGPRNGYVVNNSNVTNNNVVFGESNAISNSDNADDDKLTNSIILGKANGIYKNCSDSKYYITDNTIIGSVNGLYKIPTTAIDNVLTKGMYNWVDASAKFPYQNIIHRTNESYIASGKYLVNVYGGAESYNNARNLIMGSHSVISNNINDSTLIGSFNAAYNSATDVWSNNYVMGSFNLAANGSNQIVLGNSNIASGHNAIPMGEGLIANTSQTVFGRYNEVLVGTNGLSADDIDSKSGALLIVGNGRHILNKSDTASIERSNAMIVSADGTVSATKFATPEVPDIGSSLNELQGIITLLQNKPTTGKHVIGVDNGVLSWIEINQ